MNIVTVCPFSIKAFLTIRAETKEIFRSEELPPVTMNIFIALNLLTAV